MRRTSRSVPAALLVVATLALAGCSGEVSVGSGPGTVEQSEIEGVVAGNITGADAADVEVSCDGDMDAEVGATQDCLATLDGSTTGIRITVDQVNEEDVDFSTVMFVTAEELATAVGDFYSGQGIGVTDVTCDGELVGEPGETAQCDITSDTDGDATVEATSTGTDGLTVNFDLEVISEG
ncbi:unannotated protein [freshwater metagenome]|uniref:Unannotated protein n=1 Tax=freshwater metagenome TaxID=449393 RepID=A0A6J6V5I1_9ZZZZ|nr:DUF4333 domain-containing protein [Actinomycetota bacterium]